MVKIVLNLVYVVFGRHLEVLWFINQILYSLMIFCWNQKPSKWVYKFPARLWAKQWFTYFKWIQLQISSSSNILLNCNYSSALPSGLPLILPNLIGVVSTQPWQCYKVYLSESPFSPFTIYFSLRMMILAVPIAIYSRLLLSKKYFKIIELVLS